MEPEFKRGDLLVLQMSYNHRAEPLEIPVFKLKGRDIPIVHRILRTHDEKRTGKQFILTKGDNNRVDDRGLYNRGQDWIQREDIMGKVVG
jgi:signal peptidase